MYNKFNKIKIFTFLGFAFLLSLLFACSNRSKIEIKLKKAKEIEEIEQKYIEGENDIKKNEQETEKYITEETLLEKEKWEKEPLVVSDDGETCYVLDYYGGPLDAKYKNFKKLDFSKNKASYIFSMESMFGYVNGWQNNRFENLEEVNFTGLNTSECDNMAHLFEGCKNLKKVNFGNIDTISVSTMYKMFSECSSLAIIENFEIDTSNVRTMRGMFFKDSLLKEVDITSFNVENVEDMSYMFYKCSNLASIDLSNFHPINCKKFEWSFANCVKLTEINLSNFEIVPESIENMFYNCKNIKKLDLRNFDTTLVSNFEGLFSGCEKLVDLNISSFETSASQNFSNMFYKCENLKYIDVYNFDTKNAKNFSHMFDTCKKLERVNVATFNTSNALSMDYMFANCENLKILDLSNFVIDNSVSINGIFSYCEVLNKLDISNMDLSKLSGDYVFDGCYNLETFLYDKKTLPEIAKSSKKNVSINKQISKISEMAHNRLYYERKKVLYNKSMLDMNSEGWLQLTKNEFIVKKEAEIEEISKSQYKEFFSYYEDNKNKHIPNFITTDSILHTYYLYFEYLLKKIEKEKLYESIKEITEKMLDKSKEYYSISKGTAFENVAKTNVAYFSVPYCIINEDYEPDEYVASIVHSELDLIKKQVDITVKPIFLEYFMLDENKNNIYMDNYAKYKPRGHYERDAILEKYYKILTWYKETNFSNLSNTLTACALLISFALNESDLTKKYDELKNIIYYFDGNSDDCSPIDYIGVIKKVYNKTFYDKSVANDVAKLELFNQEIKSLKFSIINLGPEMYETKEDLINFRFIGQVYNYDDEIFNKLIDDNVDKANSIDGEKLPDVLDIPATFNSKIAKNLLKNIKDKNNLSPYDYPKYEENLNKLNDVMIKKIQNDATNNFNIQYFRSLMKLVINEDKNELYPSFMLNDEWKKKRLETFVGSYAELKSDNTIYEKQTYGETEISTTDEILYEFYDEEILEYDDRGYVEPEVDVYNELYLLATFAENKLQNVLEETDSNFLKEFSELSLNLRVIAEKELKNEKLTIEEYDLIRDYDSSIKHLLVDSGAYVCEANYLKSNAVVSDIAEGKLNGTYYTAKVATGNPLKMYVLVKVDDKYKICSGAVYDSYQFEVPSVAIITNVEWRTMMGFDIDLIVNRNKNNEENDLYPWDIGYVDDRYVAHIDKKNLSFQNWNESYRYSNYCSSLSDNGKKVLFEEYEDKYD